MPVDPEIAKYLDVSMPDKATESALSFLREHLSTDRIYAIQAQTVAYLRGVIDSHLGVNPDLPEEQRPRLSAQVRELSREFNRVSRRRDGFDRRDLVDNFLTYLAELSSEILRRRPEILRSGRTVTLEAVLRFSNLDEFIASEVDRRIHELAFGGFGTLSDAFEQDFKLPIASSEEERQSMKRAVLVRNLVTHQRGRVGARFRADWIAAGGGPEDFSIGTQLSGQDILTGIDARQIVRTVLDLDRAATDKYGLENHSLEGQLSSYVLNFDEVFARLEQGAEPSDAASTS